LIKQNLQKRNLNNETTNEVSSEEKFLINKTQNQINIKKDLLKSASHSKMLFTNTKYESSKHIPNIIPNPNKSPSINKSFIENIASTPNNRSEILLKNFYIKGNSKILEELDTNQNINREFSSLNDTNNRNTLINLNNSPPVEHSKNSSSLSNLRNFYFNSITKKDQFSFKNNILKENNKSNFSSNISRVGSKDSQDKERSNYIYANNNINNSSLYPNGKNSNLNNSKIKINPNSINIKLDLSPNNKNYFSNNSKKNDSKKFNFDKIKLLKKLKEINIFNDKHSKNSINDRIFKDTEEPNTIKRTKKVFKSTNSIKKKETGNNFNSSSYIDQFLKNNEKSSKTVLLNGSKKVVDATDLTKKKIVKQLSNKSYTNTSKTINNKNENENSQIKSTNNFNNLGKTKLYSDNFFLNNSHISSLNNSKNSIRLNKNIISKSQNRNMDEKHSFLSSDKENTNGNKFTNILKLINLQIF